MVYFVNGGKSKLPILCRTCKHKMLGGYCITAKKSEIDWLAECDHYEPKDQPKTEKPIKKIAKGQTTLDGAEPSDCKANGSDAQ